MEVCFDIEADGLTPRNIWVVVCKDINTGERYVFRKPQETREFHEFAGQVRVWIGHNCIGYDLPVLGRLLGLTSLVGITTLGRPSCYDTLVLSRMVNFNRPGGHSLEQYGEEFGVPKPVVTDWSTYSEEIVHRCVEDVEITERVFRDHEKYARSQKWADAIETEHFKAWVCTDLHTNGFPFDLERAVRLQARIQQDIDGLDQRLREAFPPRSVLVREIVPRPTTHGTINRTDFRWHPTGDLSEFSVGCPFSLVRFEKFNPGSAKQRVERLNDAGWRPTEKTDGHKDVEKELRQLRRQRRPDQAEIIKDLEERLQKFRVYGWKTSEENLATLPDTAPEGAKLLARRLILAPRASTLQQWINLYRPETGCIHGEFHSIGAWSHRMAHSEPNMGNVPKFNSQKPELTPYSDEIRACWTAGPDEYLVGVDAESIQMRVFAHYAQDEELIHAICAGSKADGTDPHSVNQRAIGRACQSRDDAKTYYYAWVLGVGIDKGAEILRCSREESREANENFTNRYPALKQIKQQQIPIDARRGWFLGFDGRACRIPGETEDERRHYAFAGYLQLGEVVVMSRALRIWYPKLQAERHDLGFKIRNYVHDEWQFTVRRDFDVARRAAETVADSIREAGEILGLRCPMAGSVLSGHGQLAIGDNWQETH